MRLSNPKHFFLSLMKRSFLLPIASILALAACAPAVPPQQSSIPVPSQTQTSPQGRIIPVTVELWKFTPNIIRAQQGESVTLQVTGISGTHGFSVPALGIEQPIFVGQTVMIPLPTGSTGTFDLSCSIQCGPEHPDMKGQIIIE